MQKKEKDKNWTDMLKYANCLGRKRKKGQKIVYCLKVK